MNCLCNNGQSPLWLACSSHDVSIVHMLLAVPDVDVNAGYAHIALHAAAHRGDLDLVSKLLAKGADPNKVILIFCLNWCQCQSCTLLI